MWILRFRWRDLWGLVKVLWRFYGGSMKVLWRFYEGSMEVLWSPMENVMKIWSAESIHLDLLLIVWRESSLLANRPHWATSSYQHSHWLVSLYTQGSAQFLWTVWKVYGLPCIPPYALVCSPKHSNVCTNVWTPYYGARTTSLRFRLRSVSETVFRNGTKVNGSLSTTRQSLAGKVCLEKFWLPKLANHETDQEAKRRCIKLPQCQKTKQSPIRQNFATNFTYFNLSLVPNVVCTIARRCIARQTTFQKQSALVSD